MNTIEKITADGVTYHLRDAAAARVDNTAVGETVWDSKTLLDRLCPGFTCTGRTVECTPAEGYPLAVTTVLPTAGCTSLTLYHNENAPLTVHFSETAQGSYRWDTGCLTRPNGTVLQLPPWAVLALPGVNTLSADAGVTTVTGRQDLLTALGLKEEKR